MEAFSSAQKRRSPAILYYACTPRCAPLKCHEMTVDAGKNQMRACLVAAACGGCRSKRRHARAEAPPPARQRWRALAGCSARRSRMPPPRVTPAPLRQPQAVWLPPAAAACRPRRTAPVCRLPVCPVRCSEPCAVVYAQHARGATERCVAACTRHMRAMSPRSR